MSPRWGFVGFPSLRFGHAPVAEVVAKPAPLVDAVHAGDDARANALLAGAGRADVNQTSSDGTTALHWAA
jgi:hypothetical protein